MKKLFTLILAACLCLAAAHAQSPDNIPPGSNVTFKITADGWPHPEVEVFKDGKSIGKATRDPNGPTNAPAEYTIALPTITIASAGSYVATATNEVGKATSDPYILTVNTAPGKPTIRVITVKPVASNALTVEVPPGTTIKAGTKTISTK